MTDYIKGGRGKKAPYQTVVIRVPEPLKDIVEQLIEEYRQTGELKPVTSIEDKPVTSIEQEPVTSISQQLKDILEDALTLKANAGGKIKDAIRQALSLLS
ncbi:hypothetical protein [Planktothrix sp. FACHB-1365]|uniref:hypothetical protein n=1 Tax=Planktothrix sp. FACHB-1365 TaxID=2692855 RepID=UPI001684037A|nr:hypothetical protein [Planktothrix sp. FACHB-1365]MBD2482090.1 hypothetical protein [Planktothrix sp. FACHB-1365]